MELASETPSQTTPCEGNGAERELPFGTAPVDSVAKDILFRSDC